MRYGESYGPPAETGWEAVTERQLSIGDEVILESRHYDYKYGYPTPSDYYRTIVGEHKTVSGPRKHLVPEPNVEFPSIPAWYMRWDYAGNGMMTQMWRRI